jgi:hypothetical protein
VVPEAGIQPLIFPKLKAWLRAGYAIRSGESIANDKWTVPPPPQNPQLAASAHVVSAIV